jgi:hypothetical protein
VPCYNAHALDVETLQLWEDRHLQKLPADSELSSAHVEYRSRWSINGNTVSVTREMRTHFDQRICDLREGNEMWAARDQIQKDLQADLVISAPTK